MTSRYLVVVNSSAGTTDRERVDAALEALNAVGTADLVVTEDLNALDAALEHLEGRTLVVAGGDGAQAGVARIHHDLIVVRGDQVEVRDGTADADFGGLDRVVG